MSDFRQFCRPFCLFFEYAPSEQTRYEIVNGLQSLQITKEVHLHLQDHTGKYFWWGKSSKLNRVNTAGKACTGWRYL